MAVKRWVKVFAVFALACLIFVSISNASLIILLGVTMPVVIVAKVLAFIIIVAGAYFSFSRGIAIIEINDDL